MLACYSVSVEHVGVKRAFKYRFYPTADQADELNRTFGCVRLVYNMALSARNEAWYQRQERINYIKTSAMLTQWKKTDELGFLADVSSVPLQQTLRHLQTAFANFWAKRARYPRFKSRKRSKASAEYTRSAFKFTNGQLTLAKMSTPLDIRWSRPLPTDAAPSTVTVSRDAAGRWFVSMLVDDPTVAPLPDVKGKVGVDAGITSLFTLSTGEKITNPKHEASERACLKQKQRRLSRKQRGSANWNKARLKVARTHAKVADRRRDHLHKVSTRLVHENQVIVIEDLNVRGMARRRNFARAISDAAWTTFRGMLEYKSAWYGRTLISIDRFHPSSKTCSACGLLRDTLPLNVRFWTCECGARHDRDVNAAKNILAAGLAVSACGDGVRPAHT